jgi:hypothetical protein
LLPLVTQANNKEAANQGRERQHSDERETVHDARHPQISSSTSTTSPTPMMRR